MRAGLRLLLRGWFGNLAGGAPYRSLPWPPRGAVQEQIGVFVPAMRMSMFKAAQLFPDQAQLGPQAPLLLFGLHERGSQLSNFLRFGGPRANRFDLPSVARYVLPREHERCHCDPRDCGR
jgi:hypothetical protein